MEVFQLSICFLWYSLTSSYSSIGLASGQIKCRHCTGPNDHCVDDDDGSSKNCTSVANCYKAVTDGDSFTISYTLNTSDQ